MSLQELRDEAIKAHHELGEALKELFSYPEDINLPAEALIKGVKSDDETIIKEFIAYTKRKTAEYKAMTAKRSS